MKNLFEQEARKEILDRMEKITSQSPRQWGEMSVDQMVWHLNRSMSYTMGEYPIAYKGNWFLKTFIKPMILGRMPFPKGRANTFVEFKATGNYDLETEKKRFKEDIDRFAQCKSKTEWPYSPLLGKFTGDNWARLNYKHIDHHRRQFGV